MTDRKELLKIIERAKHLADMKMDELRSWHPHVLSSGSIYEGRLVTQGLSKGDIIQDILLAEFHELIQQAQ